MLVKPNSEFPILYQKNFTKVKVVYRLEDADGEGPFAFAQLCSSYLVSHYDPEELWKVMRQRVCKKTFSKNALESCYGLMIFGWRTRTLYNKFFKPGGQEACAVLGYNLVEYRPTCYIPLPDGQVMFVRP